MSVKVAINGFGRIGRLVTRAAMQRPDIEIVAINDLGSADSNAHLFKYDSIHGEYKGDVQTEANNIIIDGKKIQYTQEKDPEKLPWKELGVQIVVEGTGAFRSKAKASKHLTAGASKWSLQHLGKA
jgi:glyceraldehyde 3-phosphate dehydrogenase